MWYKVVSKSIVEYISSLPLVVLDPKNLVEGRIFQRIPNIVLGLVTMILFSTAKYQVISGIIMFKTLEMLVALFPQYGFLTYYAGYVNAWGVFLGVVVDVLLLLSFTLLFYAGMKLLGIKHSFNNSLTIVSFSWISEVIVIIAGLVALPFDIVSSALILIISLIIALALKACIIVNAYTKVFSTKWVNVLAVLLISIIVLGLIIIGVIMV